MNILEDVLVPGLGLVICGSAVGTRSAELGAYYAGPGNQFWGMLHRVGLTPRLLRPAEFRTALQHGIGFTDIVKTKSGADNTLRSVDFDPHCLRRTIQEYQPRVLTFNGKRAASAFFGGPVAYSYQVGQDIGATRIFVAPSTSGAARGFWDESVWRRVAEAVQGATAETIAASTDSGR
jgi:TDG/mug DNA glycosylase family protein